MKQFPETNAQERQAATLLVRLIDQVAELEEELAEWRDPLPGSPLDQDNRLAPRIPTHLTALTGLRGAAGCLTSLEAWLGIERSRNELKISTRPYGGYAILRNAMEYAAAALWVLDSESSRARLKRVFTQDLTDASYRSEFAQEAGLPIDGYDDKLKRLLDYSEQAGIGWNPALHGKRRPLNNSKKDRYPSQTSLLKEIEHHRTDDEAQGLSWLGAWQLASGLAHGKSWAVLAVTQSTPRLDIDGSHGNSFTVTMPYQSILSGFYDSKTLLEAGVRRYRVLATVGQDDSKNA